MLAAFFLLQALLLQRLPEGWASLIVSVTFLGGIQLIGLGAVGEYIGRIFITQNKRPQFIIREIQQSQDTRRIADNKETREDVLETVVKQSSGF